MATLVHDEPDRRGPVQAGAGGGVSGGPDAARRRATSSPGHSRARRSWRSGRSLAARGGDAVPRARGGAAAPAGVRSGDDRRAISGAALSRRASSSRPHARSAADAAPEKFGLALGIAFQIVDDILDCGGERSRPGRSRPGADLREGTPTLPLHSPRSGTASSARARRRAARGALVRVAATERSSAREVPSTTLGGEPALVPAGDSPQPGARRP